jgi:hypothetical protein
MTVAKSFDANDWNLFDGQLIEIKRLMWKHAIQVDFPVMPANGKSIARALLAKHANNLARSQRAPRPDFSRFIPRRA